MLNYRNFLSVKILMESYNSNDIRHVTVKANDMGKRKLKDTSLFWQEIKHFPYPLERNVSSFKKAIEVDSSFEFGIRFLLILDFQKNSFFIYIFPASTLHKAMVKTIDDNKKIINGGSAFDYSFFKLYNAHNLPELITNPKLFLIPGFIGKDGDFKIGSNGWVMQAIKADILKQSGGKFDFDSKFAVQ